MVEELELMIYVNNYTEMFDGAIKPNDDIVWSGFGSGDKVSA